MMEFEILSLCVSIISVIIAITSLIRTRKVATEQLKLERITAQLAEKQISQIDEATYEKTQPNLRVDLTKLGDRYQFLIANLGDSSAHSLTFDLIDCPDSPLDDRETDEKFPYPELKPQSRIKLIAGIHLNSPRIFLARLTWLDTSGNKHSEDFHLSL